MAGISMYTNSVKYEQVKESIKARDYQTEKNKTKQDKLQLKGWKKCILCK